MADKEFLSPVSLAVLKLKNTAGTFVNLFANATTAARTWTFPDKTGTVAMLDDIPTLPISISNGGTGLTSLPHVNGFRLTLTSGTPVTTSDVTGATTIYAAPHSHNLISLWNGTEWRLYQSAEMSKSLGTLTNAIGYDVFCFLNSGVPTLEFLAWSNATTRATAVVQQNGVWVKSGDATRRLLGSFYTTSTTTTEDSMAKRFVSNVDNRVNRKLFRTETAANWTYSTSTIRQANGNTANQVSVFNTLDIEPVTLTLTINRVVNSITTNRAVAVGIGLDSTTTITGQHQTGNAGVSFANISAKFDDFVGIGKHDLNWLEYGGGADTQTWFNTSLNSSASGLSGFIKG